MGRWQVDEWRGWEGRHTVGLGLHPAAGAGAGAGAVWHMTGWEKGRECQWGQSVHGVAWVPAIGGVMVAHDRAGDMRWVAGGQMERVGAWSM